jgi:hypothetical protein
MDYCKAKHQCTNGSKGECHQILGHLGQHLCSACMGFFAGEPARAEMPAGAGIASASGLNAGSRKEAFVATPIAAPTPREATPVANFSPQPQAMPQAPPLQVAPFQIFGVWQSQVPTPYGVMATELILQPNQRFSQTAILGSMMTYDVGTVQLFPEFIHFKVEDHEPKKYNGQDMHWLQSWSYIYKVIDANTMSFEDQIAHTRWTVHRRA